MNKVRNPSVLLALMLLTLACADEARAAPPPDEITLQSHRITQGLEWHGPASSRSDYDFVAGKDTLVRAVVNSRDPVRVAICTVLWGAVSRS